MTPPPRSRSSVPPTIAADTGRTGMSPDVLEHAVLDHLYYTCAQDRDSASTRDLYVAMAHAMRDRILHRWLATRRAYRAKKAKRVYYLSAEFLLGRLMAQNLLSLGLEGVAREVLSERGLSLERVLREEPDPGLGNGGLGRLAACFLDSMATLSLPGFGYGIRYEYGIFEQRIEDGQQVEAGDPWLRFGNPWEIPRYDLTVPVSFFGRVETHRDRDGRECRRWVDAEEVLGVPYDLPIAGYGTNNVNTLRLWAARATRGFNLELFNAGDFRKAVEGKATSEAISRVLYPADHSPEGKELRLKQQYFFCRCAVSDIVRRFQNANGELSDFSDKVAIQLNDTHPSITIAELMRVLVDEHGIEWQRAWDATQRTVGYTNHTLMPEALETWPLGMFERLLPRHLEIIYEINHRLLKQVHIFAPQDHERLARTSIIQEHPERAVRMAHLAAAGSHSVNGVAALHSDLVRTKLLPEFHDLWPERFNNKTNGVSPRRWLMVANPALCEVFDQRVGAGWRSDMHKLRELTALEADEELHAQLEAIKRGHKEKLAEVSWKTAGVRIDPQSMFVVQVKRIHEYKRQLLNALHIVSLYQRLKADPNSEQVPRTFVFAGKAAPGYLAAKEHIRFIHAVAELVNADPAVNDKLRVVFLPNYSVTLAEQIIPAADISLQISLAGTEASGTGNMKLSMNGALTLGTLDGANVEIREHVGEENFLLFGMNTEEVEQCRRSGYHPGEFIERSPALASALDFVEGGGFSPDDLGRFAPLIQGLRQHDGYMLCADFDAYTDAQQRAAELYADRAQWNRMVVHNIARMGHFSSDETIRRYAADIWGLTPVPVEIAKSTDD